MSKLVGVVILLLLVCNIDVANASYFRAYTLIEDFSVIDDGYDDLSLTRFGGGLDGAAGESLCFLYGFQAAIGFKSDNQYLGTDLDLGLGYNINIGENFILCPYGAIAGKMEAIFYDNDDYGLTLLGFARFGAAGIYHLSDDISFFADTSVFVPVTSYDVFYDKFTDETYDNSDLDAKVGFHGEGGVNFKSFFASFFFEQQSIYDGDVKFREFGVKAGLML